MRKRREPIDATLRVCGKGSPVMAESTTAFAVLRRFARSREPAERCEMCSAVVAAGHPHLVEIASHRIHCACDACATLFDGMTGSKYRRVSRRVVLLCDFQITDAQWESLLIPINMAFFFHSSPESRIAAFYPSPAGAVESLLQLDAWSEIVRENAALKELQPDVESLLVNRVGRASECSRSEYYIAPVDECYRLVGLIRSHWRGLSGGTEAWTEIAEFFNHLRSRATLEGSKADA